MWPRPRRRPTCWDLETGIAADTVAKLLHEWHHPDRPPLDRYRLAPGATVIVDEAGTIGTSTVHQLVRLAHAERWRVVLVGDPRQLQAVGRGGLFTELCATGQVHELARIHRFTHPWEAAASLQLRAGDPVAMDAYEAHGRIVAGPLADQLDRIARDWLGHHTDARTVALVASTNDHVDALNDAVQRVRLTVGDLDPSTAVPIGDGEHAHIGDIVASRRNHRGLCTPRGEPVRNRDLWTVAATHGDGALTVSHLGAHGSLTLPADYTREHLRLGYVATEHGHQVDTVDISIALVSRATTHRGLYVGVTRGVTRTGSTSSPTPPTSAKPATSSTPSSPTTAPTSPPSPNATTSPDRPTGTGQRTRTGRPGMAHRLRGPASSSVAAISPPVLPNEHTDAARRPPSSPPCNRRSTPHGRRGSPTPTALTSSNTSWSPCCAQRCGKPTTTPTGQGSGSATAPPTAPRSPPAESTTPKHRIAATSRRRRSDQRTARRRRSRSEKARPACQPEHRPLRHRAARPWSASRPRPDSRGDRTWTTWASGRPVPLSELADAVSLLHDVARHAPPLAIRDGDVDRTRWSELLEPVTALLEQRGLPTRDQVGHDLEHAGPDLSIDL